MYRFIWKIKLYNHITKEQFITHWTSASKVLQEYPGAMGTVIHRVRDEERTYMLVATWKSQDARDAMDADTAAGTSERAQRWAVHPPNDSFGDIQVLMAGTAIGSVMPPATAGDCIGIGHSSITPRERDELLS